MIRIKLADDVKTISIKNKFEQVCFRSALRQNLLFNFIETEEEKKKSDRSLQSQHSQHGTEDCYKACLI